MYYLLLLFLDMLSKCFNKYRLLMYLPYPAYGFINVPLDSRLDALNAVWRHPKAVSCPNVADDWCQHDGSIHTARICGVALPGGIQLGIIRKESW